MDVQEYVAARRTSLVRAAVLLGVAEVAAPRIVRDTLLREARTSIARADPDPVVYARWSRPLRRASRLPLSDDPGRTFDARSRRWPTSGRWRSCVDADLTPHETGAALGLRWTRSRRSRLRARAALGAHAPQAHVELMALAGRHGSTTAR